MDKFVVVGSNHVPLIQRRMFSISRPSCRGRACCANQLPQPEFQEWGHSLRHENATAPVKCLEMVFCLPWSLMPRGTTYNCLIQKNEAYGSSFSVNLNCTLPPSVFIDDAMLSFYERKEIAKWSKGHQHILLNALIWGARMWSNIISLCATLAAELLTSKQFSVMQYSSWKGDGYELKSTMPNHY